MPNNQSMTPEQKAAYIISQTACMLVACAEMTAENQWRERCNQGQAWPASCFAELPKEFGLIKDQVKAFFDEDGKP
jgi:hypothetical protein